MLTLSTLFSFNFQFNSCDIMGLTGSKWFGDCVAQLLTGNELGLKPYQAKTTSHFQAEKFHICNRFIEKFRKRLVLVVDSGAHAAKYFGAGDIFVGALLCKFLLITRRV